SAVPKWTPGTTHGPGLRLQESEAAARPRQAPAPEEEADRHQQHGQTKDDNRKQYDAHNSTLLLSASLAATSTPSDPQLECSGHTSPDRPRLSAASAKCRGTARIRRVQARSEPGW